LTSVHAARIRHGAWLSWHEQLCGYAWLRPYRDSMMIAGIAMMVGGTALVVLGAIARAGKLNRQSAVGLRTEATLASDEAWEAAHEASATWVVAAGAVLFAGGVFVMLTDSETTGDIVALTATAVMLIPLVIAFRSGQAAARSV
jgi:uncharacterized membrane protein